MLLSTRVENVMLNKRSSFFFFKRYNPICRHITCPLSSSFQRIVHPKSKSYGHILSDCTGIPVYFLIALRWHILKKSDGHQAFMKTLEVGNLERNGFANLHWGFKYYTNLPCQKFRSITYIRYSESAASAQDVMHYYK